MLDITANTLLNPLGTPMLTMDPAGMGMGGLGGIG